MPRSIITQNWVSSAPENPYADIHENTSLFPILKAFSVKALFPPFLGHIFVTGITCTTFAFRCFTFSRDLCWLLEFM